MIWRVLALGAALTAGGVLWWWLSRLWRRSVLRLRRDRGRQGELAARDVLTDAGYQILEDQPSRQMSLTVDGQARGYTLRPDYLVRRGDRRYVVEVKTGKKAPDPLYSPTRRQLLEYEVCFGDHGLLLVDMENHRVHQVGWDEVDPWAGRRPRSSRRWLILLLAGAFGLGFALGSLVVW